LENNYLNYRNAAYLRGAVFLSRLREEMGEAQFFAFLRAYRERYQGEIVSGEEFFALLDEYQDPQSLDWLGEFFSQQ
jgi:aminopeptidase N